MPGQFEGKRCVLCPGASSRTGEHVLPRWLVAMFPDHERPYTWSINGDPVPTRRGLPRTHTSIGSVKLPMCPECNGVLASRFEEPAKPIIRRIFDTDGETALSGPEAHVVGMWFLKTWLLLAHPVAKHSEPGIAPPTWNGMERDLWSWTVRNQPPSDGLSVWLSRRGDENIDPNSTRHIPLPTVISADQRIEFASKRAGLRSLDVSLVHHPDWPIEHPLEVEGRAARLWPRDPRDPLDLANLPPVNPRDTTWLKGPTLRFAPGTFPYPELPPLSPDLNLMMDLPPGSIEMASW